jgi:hypothetical protein
MQQGNPSYSDSLMQFILEILLRWSTNLGLCFVLRKSVNKRKPYLFQRKCWKRTQRTRTYFKKESCFN